MHALGTRLGELFASCHVSGTLFTEVELGKSECRVSSTFVVVTEFHESMINSSKSSVTFDL